MARQHKHFGKSVFSSSNSSFPDPKTFTFPPQAQLARPQMVLSIDSNIYDLRRPFEPPIPDDPDANICRNVSVEKVSKDLKSIGIS